MTDRSPLAPAAFPALPAIAGVTLRVARAHYKQWDRCDQGVMPSNGLVTRERRSRAAIQSVRKPLWIASLRSQ